MDAALLAVRTLAGLGVLTEETPRLDAAIWQPHVKNVPQQLAYALAQNVMEIGFGGQAGGGKSDLALGLAGSMFYKSLILRREFPQLEAMIDRGNQLFPVPFVGGSKHRWEFGDRVITLASLQREADWKKYQGRGNDLIVFDEAAEFPERPVRFITGWGRTAVAGRHTLVLYCFNPPTTAEGEWIIRYFAPWIDPAYPGGRAESGEVRWMAHLPGSDNRVIEVPDGAPFEHEGEIVYPISRTFIASSRRDNPFLGEDYERRLQMLPEPLRTMLMKGDFTVGTQDDAWQVIPTNWVLEAQRRWELTPKPDAALRAVGVDVAHGGPDKTTIAKLYANWFAELLSYPGEETPRGSDVVDRIARAMESNAPVGIDAVGYGASATEGLEDLKTVRVQAINAGAASSGMDKARVYGFFNTRAEMYWTFREALDPENGEQIALPPSRLLRVELCAARYKVVGARYQIEPKEDIRKRLGHSPDEAEAVLHCWYTAHRPPLRVGVW